VGFRKRALWMLLVAAMLGAAAFIGLDSVHAHPSSRTVPPPATSTAAPSGDVTSNASLGVDAVSASRTATFAADTKIATLPFGLSGTTLLVSEVLVFVLAVVLIVFTAGYRGPRGH
jgi:hypothetical protein